MVCGPCELSLLDQIFIGGEHTAQILIGREGLQSNVPIFTNRPMIFFDSVNKLHTLQNLGHFCQPLLEKCGVKSVIHFLKTKLIDNFIYNYAICLHFQRISLACL